MTSNFATPNPAGKNERQGFGVDKGGKAMSSRRSAEGRGFAWRNVLRLNFGATLAHAKRVGQKSASPAAG